MGTSALWLFRGWYLSRAWYKQRPNPLISELGRIHCILAGVGEKEEGGGERQGGLRSGYHDHEHAELNVVFSDLQIQDHVAPAS